MYPAGVFLVKKITISGFRSENILERFIRLLRPLMFQVKNLTEKDLDEAWITGDMQSVVNGRSE